jgi:hypothetical protein
MEVPVFKQRRRLQELGTSEERLITWVSKQDRTLAMASNLADQVHA